MILWCYIYIYIRSQTCSGPALAASATSQATAAVGRVVSTNSRPTDGNPCNGGTTGGGTVTAGGVVTAGRAEKESAHIVAALRRNKKCAALRPRAILLGAEDRRRSLAMRRTAPSISGDLHEAVAAKAEGYSVTAASSATSSWPALLSLNPGAWRAAWCLQAQGSPAGALPLSLGARPAAGACYVALRVLQLQSGDRALAV